MVVDIFLIQQSFVICEKCMSISVYDSAKL